MPYYQIYYIITKPFTLVIQSAPGYVHSFLCQSLILSKTIHYYLFYCTYVTYVLCYLVSMYVFSITDVDLIKTFATDGREKGSL